MLVDVLASLRVRQHSCHLPAVFTHEWEKVTRGKLAVFVMGFVLFIALLFKSERGFVVVLDHANLLFHEAGHPVAGLFSTRLAPYGGTLGQLVFPSVLAAAFWQRGQPLSFAAGLLWFFENLFNIARYMADARALELPLVGGGDHDWNTILSTWGLLGHDTRLAAVVQTLGWLGITATFAWVLWRAYRDATRASQTAETPADYAQESRPSAVPSRVKSAVQSGFNFGNSR
jgi:hypothetical protein